MLLFLLAYLGGVLTILSPCILPVLPFVFARSEAPFVRNGLPMLAGMALTFAGVATLAAVGSQWVTEANQIGRWVALALMAAFAIALLSPALAARLMQPVQALGGRLSQRADAAGAGGQGSIGASVLLGVATGLLWAPCAGPILGLVLTGAALQGASASTSLLLLAYALGAATSLAVALLVGGRVFAAMKRSLGAGEWVRRALGVLVLAAVAAIALGLDTGLLTRLSTVSTARVEQSLLERFNAAEAKPVAAPARRGAPLPVEGSLPALDGATTWLNSAPLDAASLRGKVVLVDFWTYSCINCLRNLPHVQAWAKTYGPQGLVVIGVHAPEFAFERDLGNVRKAVADLGINYPVAVDNGFKIWRSFNNRSWPAHYLVDAQGRIRAHHVGEGDYAETEQHIRALLAEAGRAQLPAMAVATTPMQGVQREADRAELKSPETYVGYGRAYRFASPEGLQRNVVHDYTIPSTLLLNQWAYGGPWKVGKEQGQASRAGSRIAFRFHARDLHLVLAPGSDATPVRFRVRIDGHAPAANHGDDIDADGIGTVREHRLYQLVHQQGAVGEHTFEIEFLDAGARAYAFTFS